MAAAAPQPQNSRDSRRSRRRSGDPSRSQWGRRVISEERRSANKGQQYLNREELPANASTDEIFNASYQNQGLQPQDLNAEDEEELVEPENRSYYQSRENNQRRKISSVQKIKSEANNFSSGRLKRRPGINKKNLIQTGVAQGKAGANSGAIFTWYGNLWLWVQLPLVVISLVGLAVYAGSESEVVAMVESVVDAAVRASPSLAIGVAALEAYTGISLTVSGKLSQIGLGIFFICHVLILTIGLISFLAMYLEYSLGFSNCLSGKKSGLKTGAILVAFIGYVTPGVNVVPWLFIWVFTVTLYPE